MFDVVYEFEQKVADFFGAPYGISTDCCTHAVELSLRYTKAEEINVPVRTYPSIAWLSEKLNIRRSWNHDPWQDYYYLTHNVIDAAVTWKRDSYIPGTFMCVSFHPKKHLSLDRGGIILLDDKEAYEDLIKIVYDGRARELGSFSELIDRIGYHYYMTPEDAKCGLAKLDDAIDRIPKQWKYEDWGDLTKMDVFK